MFYQHTRDRRLRSSTHTVKFDHDNAKPHVHKYVHNYLKSKDITIIR